MNRANQATSTQGVKQGVKVPHAISCGCGFSTKNPNAFLNHSKACNGQRKKPEKVFDRASRKYVNAPHLN